jgi:hypothetical protein
VRNLFKTVRPNKLPNNLPIQNVTTGDSNDATVNDTVIWFTHGTSATTDDEIVMVLEDWTADLTFSQLDLV